MRRLLAPLPERGFRTHLWLQDGRWRFRDWGKGGGRAEGRSTRSSPRSSAAPSRGAPGTQNAEDRASDSPAPLPRTAGVPPPARSRPRFQNCCMASLRCTGGFGVQHPPGSRCTGPIWCAQKGVLRVPAPVIRNHPHCTTQGRLRAGGGDFLDDSDQGNVRFLTVPSPSSQGYCGPVSAWARAASRRSRRLGKSATVAAGYLSGSTVSGVNMS